MKNYLLLSISFLVISCGSGADGIVTSTSTEGSSGEGNPTPAPGPNPPPNADSKSIDEKLFICSKLDFVGMKSPSDLSDIQINMFALGLNISSTFEGRQGWKNITNNFDGMGLSLGLLNQTLGTGSLQPLLIKMLEKHEAVMRAQYKAANYTSIKAMALDWKLATGFVVNALQQEDLFAPNDLPYNELDQGEVFTVQGAAENKSVSWAKSTIYTDAAGTKFKTDWKAELQAMAGTKEYRDLQFAAARSIHNKAAGYVTSFGLTEIRSYLFMFDIVVQNGGFYQKNIDDYRTFIRANPRATEEQKLNALLTSRLVQVRSQYREDVKARKQGLINGKGRVHQTDRNFETEYCYKSKDVI
jgi:hypothetical protein